MDILSICSRKVVTIDAGDSLQQAALQMREHHVGTVLVTRMHDGAVEAVGIVSDRDLAIEVLARGGDASQVPVLRLVQRPPLTIAASAGLGEAVQAMQAAGVRRLLVHDDQGHVAGIVSADDVLGALVPPLIGLADLARAGREREARERGSLAPPAPPLVRVPASGTAGWHDPIRAG